MVVLNQLWGYFQHPVRVEKSKMAAKALQGLNRMWIFAESKLYFSSNAFCTTACSNPIPAAQTIISLLRAGQELLHPFTFLPDAMDLGFQNQILSFCLFISPLSFHHLASWDCNVCGNFLFVCLFLPVKYLVSPPFILAQESFKGILLNRMRRTLFFFM